MTHHLLNDNIVSTIACVHGKDTKTSFRFIKRYLVNFLTHFCRNSSKFSEKILKDKNTEEYCKNQKKMYNLIQKGYLSQFQYKASVKEGLARLRCFQQKASFSLRPRCSAAFSYHFKPTASRGPQIASILWIQSTSKQWSNRILTVYRFPKKMFFNTIS